MTPAQTPALIRVSIRVYRVLLRLYPRQHRLEYGEMMVDLFDDMCRTTYHQHQSIGIIKLWLRTLKDTAIAAIIEHTERTGDPVSA